ncbi:MAG: type II secretion system protein [Patescibacteria group bacterium]
MTFNFFERYRIRSGEGFTLIEAILGVAIFALVASSLFVTYQRVFALARSQQARINAIALANEQFEIARNLSYSDVGLLGGIPQGKLVPVQTLVRAGMTFVATTTVRNIDQPFDGTLGGIPNDLSPADNKLVEIDIMCTSCVNFRPMILTTTVGPKDLEGNSTNGALFIRALDATGQPVSTADVHIYNNTTTTTIDIFDVTATSGLLQIVDAPPGFETYQITVSKAGYSSERTYGSPTTTNPVKPHATVTIQTVTQLSFAIDRTATLNFSSVTPSCAPVPNVGMALDGSKLIATSPDVKKYAEWISTGASGLRVLNDIEWDNYTLAASSTTHDLAGVMPLSPFAVTPGEDKNIQLIMVPKNSAAVLVTVKDLATGLPITGATVELKKGSEIDTQITGRGYLEQTDWSGGAGQADFIDPTRYAWADTNIDDSDGQVRLRKVLGEYQSPGVLESSTFDTGSQSNFYQLTYQPTDQLPQVGESRVNFQLATGNSTSSWTYLGPDGTVGTYYNATTTDIASVNNGNRYLRYKLYLDTLWPSQAPNVSDVRFTFTSSCIPSGQVFFQGLGVGTYSLTVTKSGYQNFEDTVSVSGGEWQEKQVSMSP